MSLHRAALCIAMLATACLKIPEFQGGGDGGNGDGTTNEDAAIGVPNAVTVVTGGGGAVATLLGLYELKFSSQAYHFPFNWGIGAQAPLTQVLRAPSDTTCTLERDFGVAYLPAHVLASVPTNGVTTALGELSVDVPGPGIAKVRLDWNATLPCGAVANGLTTFSLFPDGRISRMDVARMPTAYGANNCACAAATDWRIYGYTTFSRGVIQGVQGEGYPATTDAVGSPLTNQIACIEGNGNAFRIGVGWKNTQGGAMASTRLRSPDATSFALNGYLTPSAQTVGGGAYGGLLGDTTTTYWPTLTASCSTLRDQIMPFTLDPMLEINTVAIGMGQDGIYGGETAFAAPGRDTLGPMVTLRSAAGDLAAFAVWLDFGVYKHDSDPIVTKDPATPTTTWYTLQRPAMQYLFWFPDGLAAGETITIRSQ